MLSNIFTPKLKSNYPYLLFFLTLLLCVFLLRNSLLQKSQSSPFENLSLNNDERILATTTSTPIGTIGNYVIKDFEKIKKKCNGSVLQKFEAIVDANMQEKLDRFFSQGRSHIKDYLISNDNKYLQDYLQANIVTYGISIVFGILSLLIFLY